MNNNEILIGREVGEKDFLVEAHHKSVGRKHARIIRKPDGIYIEDLDSKYGTFVNNKEIRLKKITLADAIFLGGIDSYKLELGKVLNKMPMSDEEFKQGFLRLKKIYDDFQAEKNKLEAKMQEDMMVKRMLPTMVMGVILGIVTAFVPDNLKAAVGIAGGLLTIGVFLMATKMASRGTLKMKEKLAQLKEEFELEYVCPACSATLGGKSWEYFKKQGKSPCCKREWKQN